MTGESDHANVVHEYAPIALSAIRLFNGIAALLAPAALLRRLGVEPEANPAALYALRMFGVRTVLIGAQLQLRNEGLRAHSLRVAPVVHALDATAAMIAGAQGKLPGARPRRPRSSRRSIPFWPSSHRLGGSKKVVFRAIEGEENREPTPPNEKPTQVFELAWRSYSRHARLVVAGVPLPNARAEEVGRLDDRNKQVG